MVAMATKIGFIRRLGDLCQPNGHLVNMILLNVYRIANTNKCLLKLMMILIPNRWNINDQQFIYYHEIVNYAEILALNMKS